MPVQRQERKKKRTCHSTVNKVSENELTDDDEVYTFSLSTETRKDQPLFKIKVHDTPITVMADSGASINILDEKEYHKLPNCPRLEPSRVKIYGYQSNVPLRVLGKFRAMLESKTRKFNDKLYVVGGSGGSLAKLEGIARAQSSSNGPASHKPTVPTGSKNTSGSVGGV